MGRFNEHWKVQPHGSLETLDDGLFTVDAEIVMPLGHFPRRMTIVVLDGRRVAVWSPIPLDEPEMRRIEALGDIAFLIVPGVGHRLDIKPWKSRYPSARIVCTAGARKAVEEVVPVDSTDDVLADPTVRFAAVPGTRDKEASMIVRRDGRATLILNDVLANVRHPRGLGAHIMARMLGFGVDRPRMPRIGRRLFVDDAAALADAFDNWAAEPGLERIVVSHGDVIVGGVRDVLHRAAADFRS
jgi:hypothetical protein